MGSSVFYALFYIWVCIYSFTFILVHGDSPGVVFIDGTSPIGRIDSDFICATVDWWPPEKCDYGTCSWDQASLLNLDLDNVILLNAIKAFSPLKIRLGGTLQDRVIYQTETHKQPCNISFVKSPSELFGFSAGCLPLTRWDKLNDFFNKSGAEIIFGLNALNGRSLLSNGSATGNWDSTNAESLVRYSVKKGYKIRGWELVTGPDIEVFRTKTFVSMLNLHMIGHVHRRGSAHHVLEGKMMVKIEKFAGNELSGNGIGTSVAPDQYAHDTTTLRDKITEIYKETAEKTQIIAPGGFFDASWFNSFIIKANKSLDVLTHHIYNLGPGVDQHLMEKILDPTYLDGEADTFSKLKNTLKNSGTSVKAWVGEAGGAYNSGHNGVSNCFVYSFWYLDQLGMSASYDTKTYCRQTLIGGNYGLLNTTTFVPNPDYYSALLWHRLMGRKVLSTNFTGTNKIRAYAHCAKKSQGVTLLLINLDGNSTISIKVTHNGTNIQQHGHKKMHHHIRTKHKQQLQQHIKKKKTTWRKSSTREEYHLTAKDGNLHSQIMLLNGQALTVDKSGNIPSLLPLTVHNSTEPIVVAPYSIVFVHIPSLILNACRNL